MRWQPLARAVQIPSASTAFVVCSEWKADFINKTQLDLRACKKRIYTPPQRKLAGTGGVVQPDISGKAVSTMPALKIGGIILAWPPPQNVPNSNSNAGRPGAFLAPFLKYCKGRTHKKEDKNGIGFLLRLGAQPDLLETRLAEFSFCEVVATLAVPLPAKTRKILCQNGQAIFLQLQNCCHVTKVVRRVRCKHTRWRDMGCFMHVKDTFFFRC